MENILFSLGSILLLWIVLYQLDFWNPEPESDSSDSELHARNRYSVAEKIHKELID